MSLKDRIKRYRELFKNSIGYFAYEKMSIRENLIYIESRDGNDIADNILSIIEEIQKEDYKKYKTIIYVNKNRLKEKQELIKACGFKNVLLTGSRTYGHFISEIAKYIIFDSTLYGKYVKREGQVVINTWHGTPYKVMGRSIASEKHTVGTVQQRYLFSDYLLFANRYMMDIMVREYMLENICQAKCLCEGYPRNARFFDDNRRQSIRKKLKLSNKQVIVYMPTFRGTMRNKKNQDQADRISRYLETIEKSLRKDQVFLVKLHPYNDAQIDYTRFTHISRFPDSLPGYDVLAASDLLVTDYSSVFFDYANADRRIILFTYDKEEYFQDRGVYFPLEELPFEKVETAEDLIKTINLTSEVDYSAFRQTFGYYDHKDATERICQHIFNGKKCCTEYSVPDNGKENVLIYGGSFAKNGITSSVISLINNLDDSRNWYLSYFQPDMVRSPSNFEVIPNHVKCIPIVHGAIETFREYKILRKYNAEDKGLNALEIDNELPDMLKKKYIREWNRNLGYARIDRVINFDGYKTYVALILVSSGKDSSIWMHNDLIQEKYVKNNVNLRALSYCYEKSRKVAVVSNQLLNVAQRLNVSRDKLHIVHNYFDYKSVIEKIQKDLVLDKNTGIFCNDPNGINHILQSQAVKFVTIGRFAPEKGHERLIRAFTRFNTEYSDSYLIIIGGYGKLYEQTKELAQEMSSWQNIVIVRSMSNPMPLLQQCDLFVLSSFHEGLPVTLFEASSLGIPVLSTDIPGPKEFITENGGIIVENNEDGLYEGFVRFYKTELNNSKEKKIFKSII